MCRLTEAISAHHNKKTMSNEAAWIEEPKAALKVGPAELYEPGPSDLLIKIESIGLVPFDWKMQKFNFVPLPFPNILGNSYAGVVEKVGGDVSGFKPGDRVVSARPGWNLQDLRYSAFQKYVLASPAKTAKLDSKTSFDDAAGTLVNLATAVGALGVFLKIGGPTQTGAQNAGKKILVYGGSSSVGGYAVQYALQSGYTVITTSSPNNMALVKKYGVDHIIDHTQPEQAIIKELEAYGPFDHVFDAAGVPASDNIIGQALAATGGVFYTVGAGNKAELPQGVERRAYNYPAELEKDENEELREWLLGKYLPQGLATGKIVPTPVEKVPGGLGAVQEGLDRLAGGVSGKKLVINPWE